MAPRGNSLPSIGTTGPTNSQESNAPAVAQPARPNGLPNPQSSPPQTMAHSLSALPPNGLPATPQVPVLHTLQPMLRNAFERAINLTSEVDKACQEKTAQLEHIHMLYAGKLQEQKNGLTTEHFRLMNELERNQKAEIDDLCQTMERRKDEAVRGASRGHFTEIAALQSNLDQVGVEKVDLAKLKTELQTELEQLKEEKEILTQLQTELETELQEAKTKLEEAETEISALTEKVEAGEEAAALANQQTEDEKTAVAEAKVQVASKLLSMGVKMKAAIDAKVKAEEKVENLEAQKGQQEREREIFTGAQLKAEEKVKNLEAQVADLEGPAQQSVRLRQQLKNESKRFQKELDASKTKLDASKKQLKESQGHLATCKAEHDASESQLKESRENLEACKARLEASQAELDERKTAFDQSKDDNHALQLKTNTQAKEIVNLKDHLKQANADKKASEAQKTKVEVDLETERESKTILRAQLDTVQHDKSAQEQKFADMRQYHGKLLHGALLLLFKHTTAAASMKSKLRALRITAFLHQQECTRVGGKFERFRQFLDELTAKESQPEQQSNRQTPAVQLLSPQSDKTFEIKRNEADSDSVISFSEQLQGHMNDDARDDPEQVFEESALAMTGLSSGLADAIEPLAEELTGNPHESGLDNLNSGPSHADGTGQAFGSSIGQMNKSQSPEGLAESDASRDDQTEHQPPRRVKFALPDKPTWSSLTTADMPATAPVKLTGANKIPTGPRAMQQRTETQCPPSEDSRSSLKRKREDDGQPRPRHLPPLSHGGERYLPDRLDYDRRHDYPPRPWGTRG